MRKTTKAEKIAAYDGLVDHKSMADLVLYDIARDAPKYRAEVHSDADNGEKAVAVGTMYRPTGGHGGIVVLLTYTIDADGEAVGHATRLASLDHVTDGIDGYGRAPMERAIVSCARALGALRAEAFRAAAVEIEKANRARWAPGPKGCTDRNGPDCHDDNCTYHYGALA